MQEIFCQEFLMRGRSVVALNCDPGGNCEAARLRIQPDVEDLVQLLLFATSWGIPLVRPVLSRLQYQCVGKYLRIDTQLDRRNQNQSFPQLGLVGLSFQYRLRCDVFYQHPSEEL
jgi:hypothetical protein